MDRYRSPCNAQDFCRIVQLLFWNSGLHLIMLGATMFILLMFDKSYSELFAGAIVIYGFTYLLAFWTMVYKNLQEYESLTENLGETKRELEKLGMLRFLRKLYCGESRAEKNPLVVFTTPPRTAPEDTLIGAQRRGSAVSQADRKSDLLSRSGEDEDVLAECVFGVSLVPPPRPITSKPTPRDSSEPSERGSEHGESLSPKITLQRTVSLEAGSFRPPSSSSKFYDVSQDALARASRRLKFKSQSIEETASSDATYLNVPIPPKKHSIGSAPRSPPEESGIERRTTRSSAKSVSKQR